MRVDQLFFRYLIVDESVMNVINVINFGISNEVCCYFNFTLLLINTTSSEGSEVNPMVHFRFASIYCFLSVMFIISININLTDPGHLFDNIADIY